MTTCHTQSIWDTIYSCSDIQKSKVLGLLVRNQTYTCCQVATFFFSNRFIELLNWLRTKLYHSVHFFDMGKIPKQIMLSFTQTEHFFSLSPCYLIYCIFFRITKVSFFIIVQNPSCFRHVLWKCQLNEWKVSLQTVYRETSEAWKIPTFRKIMLLLCIFFCCVK